MNVHGSGRDGGSAFESWLDIYERAHQDPGAIATLECPSCARQALSLLLVVDPSDDLRGTAVFWCNACLRGLPPNRALVPQGAVTARRGTEEVPNYRLVLDEEV